MAINKQIFTAANTATFAGALQDALEALELFDTVTVSGSVVTATKNGVDIISFNFGIVAGGNLATVKNATGTTLGTIAYSSVYGGHSMVYPASITSCGTGLMLIFSAQNSGGSTCIYIDSTMDDKVAIAACNRSEGSYAYKAASEDSVSFDTAYSLNAPLSTAYTNTSLYKVTAQLANSNIAVFRSVYGIRFSPDMHTRSIPATTAGVTPTSITINDTPYVTDGTVCMMDV